jgi:hypothetical protein
LKTGPVFTPTKVIWKGTFSVGSIRKTNVSHLKLWSVNYIYISIQHWILSVQNSEKIYSKSCRDSQFSVLSSNSKSPPVLSIICHCQSPWEFNINLTLTTFNTINFMYN